MVKKTPKRNTLADNMYKIMEYINVVDNTDHSILVKLTEREISDEQLNAILTVLVKTGLIKRTITYSSVK